MKLTFVTGNAHKADYVAKVLGQQISHHKLDLDEIQSLDLTKIVEHKVKQAYGILKSPVLVEDVALEMHAFGRLPGPFIKWFTDEIGNAEICKMLGQQHDRAATAKICYGFFDGKTLRFFNGEMKGKIATSPKGDNGFGWDKIFIKDGMSQTRAELTEVEEKSTSMRKEPLKRLATFLKH